MSSGSASPLLSVFSIQASYPPPSPPQPASFFLPFLPMSFFPPNPTDPPSSGLIPFLQPLLGPPHIPPLPPSNGLLCVLFALRVQKPHISMGPSPPLFFIFFSFPQPMGFCTLFLFFPISFFSNCDDMSARGPLDPVTTELTFDSPSDDGFCVLRPFRPHLDFSNGCLHQAYTLLFSLMKQSELPNFLPRFVASFRF